jgi:hypothetical protein
MAREHGRMIVPLIGVLCLGAGATHQVPYRDTGATTADLVAAFRKASPKSERVLKDWLLTTRWYARLASGETVQQMVDGYKAR